MYNIEVPVSTITILQEFAEKVAKICLIETDIFNNAVQAIIPKPLETGITTTTFVVFISCNNLVIAYKVYEYCKLKLQHKERSHQLTWWFRSCTSENLHNVSDLEQQAASVRDFLISTRFLRKYVYSRVIKLDFNPWAIALG